MKSGDAERTFGGKEASVSPGGIPRPLANAKGGRDDIICRPTILMIRRRTVRWWPAATTSLLFHREPPKSFPARRMGW